MGCLSLMVITAEKGDIEVSRSRMEAFRSVWFFIWKVGVRWVFKQCKVLGEGRGSFCVLSNGLKKAILTWIEPGHMLESVYLVLRNIDLKVR